MGRRKPPPNALKTGSLHPPRQEAMSQLQRLARARCETAGNHMDVSPPLLCSSPATFPLPRVSLPPSSHARSPPSFLSSMTPSLPGFPSPDGRNQTKQHTMGRSKQLPSLGSPWSSFPHLQDTASVFKVSEPGSRPVTAHCVEMKASAGPFDF